MAIIKSTNLEHYKKIYSKYMKGINRGAYSRLLRLTIEAGASIYPKTEKDNVILRIFNPSNTPNIAYGHYPTDAIDLTIPPPYRMVQAQSLEDKILHIVTRTIYKDTLIADVKRYSLNIGALSSYTLRKIIEFIYTNEDPRANLSWIKPLQDVCINHELTKGRKRINNIDHIYEDEIIEEHPFGDAPLPSRRYKTSAGSLLGDMESKLRSRPVPKMDRPDPMPVYKKSPYISSGLDPIDSYASSSSTTTISYANHEDRPDIIKGDPEKTSNTINEQDLAKSFNNEMAKMASSRLVEIINGSVLNATDDDYIVPRQVTNTTNIREDLHGIYTGTNKDYFRYYKIDRDGSIVPKTELFKDPEL